jgi:hypothetical protein
LAYGDLNIALIPSQVLRDNMELLATVMEKSTQQEILLRTFIIQEDKGTTKELA